ncbi:hypothetical protein V2J09_007095 [Rumex salicifolius]
MKEAAFLKMALAITTTMMLFQIATKPAAGKELHPIVLVPGSGGNQLEARLNSDYNPSSFFCRKYWHDSRSDNNRGKVKSDGWYRIWFDPSVLVAPFTKCFSERMMLVYDPVSDDYHNAPGVETRAPHFGSVKSLLYLAPPLKHISAYMAPLVESLEEIGYVDGENLYGAPYDFRYGIAADGHPCRVGTQYLQDLKNLIERAVASNSGRPAVIVAHSLGGLLTLHLLLRSDPAWRRNFVKHVVAFSTPWSGTVQMMLTFASGYTLGVPFVNPLLVRDQQRSTETNLWLMPMPATFGRSKPLVITPNANYTAGDILRFLNDIGCAQGVRRYVQRILPLIKTLEAPHVPVTCLVGSGVPTAETLVYGEGGFDEQPEMVYGDGDGTVNMESLVAPEREWDGDRNQTVKVIKFPGVSHTGILQDKSAIERVLSVVSDINSGVVDLDFAAR